MKSFLTCRPVPPAPPIVKPFLWESTTGCVYLRNVDNQDIIVGPKVCDRKMGRVTTPYTDDAAAWARRLDKGAGITIVQD